MWINVKGVCDASGFTKFMLEYIKHDTLHFNADGTVSILAAVIGMPR